MNKPKKVEGAAPDEGAEPKKAEGATLGAALDEAAELARGALAKGERIERHLSGIADGKEGGEPVEKARGPVGKVRQAIERAENIGHHLAEEAGEGSTVEKARHIGHHLAEVAKPPAEDPPDDPALEELWDLKDHPED